MDLNYEIIKKELLRKQPKLRKSTINDLKKYLILKEKYKLQFDPRVKRLKDHHNYKVFTVDGGLIRKEIDIDFAMAGHGFRYLYIPADEIWIEHVYYNTSEIRPVVIHEYTELDLMKKGISYSKAHNSANIKELVFRRKETIS